MKYISLFEEFKKDSIQYKKPLGKGDEHTVYHFNARPDLVIKKFTADLKIYDMEEWEKMITLSQRHPEIFAIVDRVNFSKGYFIQEKLDVDTLTAECQKLEEYLLKSGLDPNYPLFQPDVISYYYLRLGRLSVFDGVSWANKTVANIKRFLDRLDQAGYSPSKERLGDIRLGNVGYDITGEIKILDFNFNDYF